MDKRGSSDKKVHGEIEGMRGRMKKKRRDGRRKNKVMKGV